MYAFQIRIVLVREPHLPFGRIKNNQDGPGGNRSRAIYKYIPNYNALYCKTYQYTRHAAKRDKKDNQKQNYLLKLTDRRCTRCCW